MSLYGQVSFSLIGLSNLYLFKYSTDYFAQASYLNPFVNTWSLSLEEQFVCNFPGNYFFSGFFRKRVERTLLLTQTRIVYFSIVINFIFNKLLCKSQLFLFPNTYKVLGDWNWCFNFTFYIKNIK